MILRIHFIISEAKKKLEVIITIFKDQLKTCPEVKRQFATLSLEVQELSTAILYIPREDSLPDFISLLNHSKICFGAHASGEEVPDVIRWNGLDKPGAR
jgi:hypothetical protein